MSEWGPGGWEGSMVRKSNHQMEWMHYPDEYNGPWRGTEDWMHFTETTCTVGSAWIGRTDEPRIIALMEWLEFHRIEDPYNSVALSTWDTGRRTPHPIIRDVKNFRVSFTHREDISGPAYVQGEAPPLPWPSILWTPDGYQPPRRPDLGSKETDHARSADQPPTDGSQRRLGVADHHPHRAGDHRPGDLYLPHGDRPRRLAPVTLDALGGSLAEGSR